jgi:hypothetical protein
MWKTVVEMGGGGPEALREVYESLSIGFQVNSLYGGLVLGGEEVRGSARRGPSQENVGSG